MRHASQFIVNKNSFAKDIRIKAKALNNLKIGIIYSDQQFRIHYVYSLAKAG